MTGDYVVEIASQRHDALKGVHQGGNILNRGKWTKSANILIEMHYIRSQNNPTARRVHAHHLQPGSMARRRLQPDAGTKLHGARLEHHPPGIVEPHDVDHILYLIARLEMLVPYVPAGREMDFRLLDMKSGGR
jgi:hypothetical protein